MGEDLATEACFTCFKKPIHFHEILDSDGDSKLNIRHIICQHFWFKEDDIQSAIVCEACWEKVNQFHQFYLDVKKLHENREVAPLPIFIKQEEITIEDTQIQENFIELSAENQKLCDIADCKLELTDKSDELPKMREPAKVFPHPRKKRKCARRLPNQRVVKRKNTPPRKVPNAQERQAEDDFIKQHMCYICDECNIEFENFRAIKKHRIEVHNKNSIACCGKQHLNRARLYQHVQSLLNPEAFKCEICGKSFKSKNSYIRHKEENHVAQEDLIFKCNRCPKSFIKEGLLKSHMGKHDTLENETAKCEFCGKCYRTKSSLNRHIKAVHNEQMDFICEVCSKGFYLRMRFLEHRKTHELTVEQLKEQCPDCNKWLKNHSTWLEHMRLHKERKCKCEECDHVSSNMRSLKRHMNYMHAPEGKRHVCEQCSKSYSRAIYLKEHVAFAHTGEHLYQCQHCEKKFFWSANLYLHRKKDHPKKWLEDRMSKYARREEVSDDGETVSGR